MNTATRLTPTLTAAALAFSALWIAPSAYADTPTEAARTHIEAIAAGNVDAITASYGPDAMLEWVGGPLDGRYAAADTIKTTWTKFTKANGPLKAEIAHLQESANPKGATVTADVVFQGKAAIPVRYVLTYRDGKLVDEIWQIDPKLANKGGY
ncbi:MAG: nuclear transport factor 2 family protein [Thiomonas sp.]|nr:nuclear transport factor 2 family protein [Thiomonas sp.]